MKTALATVLLLACGAAEALTCTSLSTGTWFAAARWSCAQIPTADDDVFVGHNPVSIDTANAVAQSVTVTDPIGANVGVLRFSGTTARTLTVSRAGSGGTGTGTVTVDLGATFTVNTATTQSLHRLILDGNLVNNGTFNLGADGNSRGVIEFNFNGYQSISGTGATTNFRQIVLNKTSINNVLEVTGLTAMTFTNGVNPFIGVTGGGGTFTLTSSLTLTNPTNTSIPANLRMLANGGTFSYTAALNINAGGFLQVDAGTFTTTNNVVVNGAFESNGGASTVNGGTGVTVNAGGLADINGGTVTVGDEVIINGGTFRIDGGDVTVGNAASERVVLQNVAGSAFEMNGGTLDISGRFTSNNATGGDAFTMTNGTLTVGTIGNGGSNVLNAPFFVGAATQFNFSGGALVIQSENTGPASREYDVNATSSTVTGGTVQIGNGATAGGEMFEINAVAPVPNFTINAANSPAVTLVAPLAVARDWTNDSAGAFTPGGNAVTFSGGVAQTIGGAQSTTFDDLTIANTSGGVSLTASQTVSATLTLTSGTFAVGANTLTLNGPTIAGTPANLATTSSSNLSFGGSSAGVNLPSSVANLDNLTVDNVNGLTLNSSPALAGTPGLTMTNGAVFTGSNTLTAATSCPGSVTRTGGHVSGNLRLAFPAGPPTCTFHLGDATIYSPLQLAFTSLTTPGALTASASSGDHPNTTEGTSGILSGTSVNRYWSLTNSAVAGTFTGTFTYVAGDNDTLGSGASYRVRRGSNCVGTGTTRTCQPWLGLAVPSSASDTQTVVPGVSIAVGALAENDLAIGALDPSTNFQRERQFIYTRELY